MAALLGSGLKKIRMNPIKLSFFRLRRLLLRNTVGASGLFAIRPDFFSFMMRFAESVSHGVPICAKHCFFLELFMKLNIPALCLVSALAFSLNACSDGDDNNNDEKQPCTQDVCQDASILLKCEAGVETPTTCQFGCDNNACKPETNPEPEKCTYTEPKCSADSKSVMTCTGGVESSKECKNGCANGACIVSCTFEGKQCNADGTAVVTCTDGEEVVDEECKNGCEDNACKAACSADVCTEDGSALIKCNDGVESTESCVNGCENNKCNDPCTYTDAKCNDDNSAALSCNAGKETVTTCEKGCVEGKCQDCTEATEADDCGAGKICVNGACEAGCTADKCEGDNLLACKDGHYEAASEANKCATKCVDDAMGDGKSICVDADYCKVSDDCKEREDGKTICLTSKHRCESLACSKAECKENETCVLGACVITTDLNAEKDADCDPKTFVDHCRGDKLAMCMVKTKKIEDKKCDEAGNECTYGVSFSNCGSTKDGFSGCAAYKDGQVVKSTCVESRPAETICGDKTSVTECKDRTSWSEITTFTCTTTTEGKRVALMTAFDYCPNEGECNDEGTACAE